jgi:hypothetical protein
MSALKQLFLIIASSFSGRIVGTGFQLYAHIRYLRNIEDFDGYKRAMNNVHKKVPGGYNGSFVLQVSPADASPQPTSEHGMITSLLPLLALIFKRGFS